MSKMPHNAVTVGDAFLNAIIAEREDRAQDRASLARAGIQPAPDALTAAPIIQGWMLIPNPHSPIGTSLSGYAFGHPIYRHGTHVRTSPLHHIDVAAGWALTEGGYYRLGEPAPEPEPEPEFKI